MNKKFNLRDKDGLYLKYESPETPTVSNYNNVLIRDYEFLPMDNQMASNFVFKNARYDNPNKIKGGNSLTEASSIFAFSEIFKKDDIIPGNLYYNKFKFYFNFGDSDIGTFNLQNLTSTQTQQILNGLRIKLYVEIGNSTIPLSLENLQIYRFNSLVNEETWTQQRDSIDLSPSGGTISAQATKTGIQLTTGLNSENCIDMRYSSSLYDNYKKSPNGYTFRVDAKFPNVVKVAGSKNYKIIIKYYNIGVTGAISPYNTSESVNLMSNNYVYYQRIL
jgi:hypothetical protein